MEKKIKMKKLKKKIIVKILRELHFLPACHNLNEYYSNIVRNPILNRHGMYVQDYDGVYYYIGYKNGEKSRKFNVITSAFLNKKFPYVSKANRILPDVNF